MPKVTGILVTFDSFETVFSCVLKVSNITTIYVLVCLKHGLSIVWKDGMQWGRDCEGLNSLKVSISSLEKDEKAVGWKG